MIYKAEIRVTKITYYRGENIPPYIRLLSLDDYFSERSYENKLITLLTYKSCNLML